MSYLYHIGRYFLLVVKVFERPEKPSVYYNLILAEIMKLGLGSLGIISIISAFMGAVITLQTASQVESAWIPEYTVGYTTRMSVVLEFAPTIIALILAGKVGSNIASELGTMRVTEQIDALEIMGINSAGYLILPKIAASLLIFPFLIIISMFLGIFAGYAVVAITEIIPLQQYVYGITYDFRPFHVMYALIKTLFFAATITSISAYHGYYAEGGALEVGASSTRAVVYSSIVILIINYIITQLLLI
jgi:phospholipid/cholesterol/gamma-HCH transport system permease protein